jgi:integrase
MAGSLGCPRLTTERALRSLTWGSRLSQAGIMLRGHLSAQRGGSGVMTFGPTNGHKRREVPIPRFLLEDLAQHVTGRAPGDFVFTGQRGAVMRSQTFQRAALNRAAAELGIPGFHPHEFRHTAASLAIASGADIKIVQQMLGHKSATLTLDLYGHLFPDRLDVVAEAMDAARAKALADRHQIGTKQAPGEVVELRRRCGKAK